MDKMKKIMLIFLTLIMLSIGVFATTELKIEDLIIPSTYNELVEAYKNVANIAINYQQLYNETEQELVEAEKDNETLMQIIENLQGLMKVQQDIIDDLLNKNRFSIFTGLNFVPLHLDYSGILAGIEFEW